MPVRRLFNKVLINLLVAISLSLSWLYILRLHSFTCVAGNQTFLASIPYVLIYTLTEKNSYYLRRLGMNPSELRGRRVGVYVGVSSSESEEAWTADPAQVTGYALTGCCRAMFPNRISYTFDFKGTFL